MIILKKPSQVELFELGFFSSNTVILLCGCTLWFSLHFKSLISPGHIIPLPNHLHIFFKFWLYNGFCVAITIFFFCPGWVFLYFFCSVNVMYINFSLRCCSSFWLGQSSDQSKKDDYWFTCRHVLEDPKKSFNLSFTLECGIQGTCSLHLHFLSSNTFRYFIS